MLRRSPSVGEPDTDASLAQTQGAPAPPWPGSLPQKKQSAPLGSGTLWVRGGEVLRSCVPLQVSPFHLGFPAARAGVDQAPKTKRAVREGDGTARESPDRFLGSRQGLIRSGTPIASGQTMRKGPVIEMLRTLRGVSGYREERTRAPRAAKPFPHRQATPPPVESGCFRSDWGTSGERVGNGDRRGGSR